MSIKYRARRTKQGVVVVRGPHGLAGIGTSAFPRMHIRNLPQNPNQIRVNEVVAEGRRPFEEAKKVDKTKRIPADADQSTVKHVFTRIRLRNTRRGSPIVDIEIAPGKWSDNFYARQLLEKVEQSRVRQALREEIKSRGKKGYVSEYPQLVGATALLTIGKKWLIIPNRGHTRLYDGYFHGIGGTIETREGLYPNHARRPHEQAREELLDETGLPTKGIQFLNSRLSRTKPGKIPRPLAFARSLEKADPSADILYAVNVATKEPDRYIQTHFKEKKQGQFELKAKPKEDEAAHFVIIPLTKKGVELFIKQNNARITPVLRIALEALLSRFPKRSN